MRILSLISISNALETMEYTLCIYTQSYTVYIQSYIYMHNHLCVYVYMCIYIYDCLALVVEQRGERKKMIDSGRYWSSSENSLVVQWLGCHASTAGDLGSIPGWGAGSPTPRGMAKKKKLLCCESSFPDPFYRAPVTIRGPVDILVFSGLSDASWHLVWLSSRGRVYYYEGRTFLCTCSSF